MNSKPIVLQDVFLNRARREQLSLRIRMMDGSELAGTVRGFDSFTVILDGNDGMQSMMYKHAIATIIPEEPALIQRPARTQPELSS